MPKTGFFLKAGGHFLERMGKSQICFHKFVDKHHILLKVSSEWYYNNYVAELDQLKLPSSHKSYNRKQTIIISILKTLFTAWKCIRNIVVIMMNAELNVAEGKALKDKPEMKEIRSTISNCLLSTKKNPPQF